jgi:hypothetical protein
MVAEQKIASNENSKEKVKKMYAPLKSLRAALLFAAVVTASAYAQPGHGGLPPGQAKKMDRDLPPGQAKKMDGNIPPGQAKKMGPDWRFRGDEREHFRGSYDNDVRRWKGRRRPSFYSGYVVPRTYVIQTVPPAYYSGLQAPPPGYRYGYYEGYVVAYNPTTRVIADVVDLVGAFTGR